MSSSKVIRIYVDSNVLINYCTRQINDVKALRYVFSKRRKEVLFTSSLAIFRLVGLELSGSFLGEGLGKSRYC